MRTPEPDRSFENGEPLRRALLNAVERLADHHFDRRREAAMEG